MSDRQKLYCTATQVRRRYGGISEMGLWRWIHDGKVNFPKPDLIVNGRRLWSEASLDAFDARLMVKEAAWAMKQKTRAQRGLRRVSENVFRQVDVQRDTPAQALRQDYLTSRFGLTPSIAGVVAELAFLAVDSWRGAR